MSASIEQRSKAQVSNGENEIPKEADFNYQQQSQVPQGGAYTGMSMADNDPYLSYYAASYMTYPPQDDMTSGMWSSADQIPYQYGGDYGAMMATDYGYAQQSGFGWFPGGDSGPWGSNLMPGDLKGEQAYPGNYYGMEMPVYGGMNGQKEDGCGVKSLEHGMKGMTIGTKRNDCSDGSGGYVNGSLPVSGSKKATWANIASQPAPMTNRPRVLPRAPLPPGRNAVDYAMWDAKNDGMMKPGPSQPHDGWAASRKRPLTMNSAGLAGPGTPYRYSAGDGGAGTISSGAAASSNSVLDKLVNANLYNPKEFDLNPKAARYFIIKSYSEDDIHRSIKYGIWCSTEYGNKRLDAAFREREGKGPVYLFFSVNGSGHFCGMTEMTSAVDYHAQSGVWMQSKWKGQFEVKWIYVKDVPNSQLRHIKLENNENKPVTNSRDTQEVPTEKGKQVLRILHQYRHTTSIFDDFSHYEKRQEEESIKKERQGSRD